MRASSRPSATRVARVARVARVDAKRPRARARARARDGAGDDDDATALDMDALRARVRALAKREEALETLRIVVLDASVPKQVLPLEFDGANVERTLNAGTALGRDARVGDRFGMLGQAPSNGQILPNGVEVTVTRAMVRPNGGESLIELTASRRFKIVGAPFEDEANGSAPSARVCWIPDTEGAGEQTVAGGVEEPGAVDPAECDAECAALAAELPALVDEWRALVISRKRERQSDQLKLILSQIGDIPGSNRPAELSLWVAALINPIPALGVAYEIRPAILCAPTTGHMVRIASQGIKLSINSLRDGPQICPSSVRPEN